MNIHVRCVKTLPKMKNSETVCHFSFFIVLKNLIYIQYIISGRLSGAFSEPSQASKMEQFAKVVNGFESITNFAKGSILDV